MVTKQGRKPGELAKLEPLKALNDRTPGMPIRAFSALTGLAPKGRPGAVRGWALLAAATALGVLGELHQLISS